ncbi:hypothetical protein ACLM2U_10240 [Bacillus pumilus]
MVQQKLDHLSPPESASLILIDLDPSQYIEKDDQVTSLVDTEYVVFGQLRLILLHWNTF